MMTTAFASTTGFGAGASRAPGARLRRASLTSLAPLAFALALGASAASAGLSNNGTSLNGITLNGTSLNGASSNGTPVDEASTKSEEARDAAPVVVQAVTLADGTLLVAAPPR